jgi:hypothetical protein
MMPESFFALVVSALLLGALALAFTLGAGFLGRALALTFALGAGFLFDLGAANRRVFAAAFFRLGTATARGAATGQAHQGRTHHRNH